MAVESRLWVEGALVCLGDLVNGVVVYLVCLLCAEQVAGCETAVGQAHEDAVEPHLIGVDSLVPIDSLLGARLLVELLHEGLHGDEVLCLGIFLVHTCDEMSRADLVEVVVLELICADFALGVDHRVGVELAVLADVVAAVAQVGVEHSLKLDAHNVAPAWLLGEVEHIGLRHALHLGIGHPFAVVLVGALLQAERTVDEEVVVFDVTCPALDLVTLLDVVEVAVLDVDVIHVGDAVERLDEHTVLALITCDVLDVHVAHRWGETAAADFFRLIVEVDLEYRLSALSHLDVAGVDVLDDASAACVGLDADDAVEIGAVHRAVLCIEVAASA